jgi:hypothetical protein
MIDHVLSIPGALFDSQSSQAYTAFRYITEKHNNGTQMPFKFDKYEKTMNLSNSFEITKASK